jgi:tRNA1(Val) A37 N6-methylase TrmN6
MSEAPKIVPEPAPDDGIDRLLGGRVLLRQPAEGYRAAIDPVLLAAALPARAGERVLDVGCGAGAAALCLARRVEGVRVVGLESQGAMAGLARGNAQLNGLADRFDVIDGDLRRPPPRLGPASFDRVMANPPYLDRARADASPQPGKAAATVEAEGAELAQWIAFCFTMVKAKGQVAIIHRADRLHELLALLTPRAGEISVLPLWPKAGRAAKRVIVAARKGVGGGLSLFPGLVLHRPDGAYTDTAEAVLRHAQPLAWSDGGEAE